MFSVAATHAHQSQGGQIIGTLLVALALAAKIIWNQRQFIRTGRFTIASGPMGTFRGRTGRALIITHSISAIVLVLCLIRTVVLATS